MMGAHRDFMAKEIAEQPEVAARIVDELFAGVADGSLWGDLHLPAPERVRVLEWEYLRTQRQLQLASPTARPNKLWGPSRDGGPDHDSRSPQPRASWRA